jgi:hypothetical protein
LAARPVLAVRRVPSGQKKDEKKDEKRPARPEAKPRVYSYRLQDKELRTEEVGNGGVIQVW